MKTLNLIKKIRSYKSVFNALLLIAMAVMVYFVFSPAQAALQGPTAYFEAHYYKKFIPIGGGVMFLNQATAGSAAIAVWKWNYGDGFVEPPKTPPHVHGSHYYNTTGIYTVTLTVTDVNGFTDTHTEENYIEVGQDPVWPVDINRRDIDSGTGFSPVIADFDDDGTTLEIICANAVGEVYGVKQDGAKQWAYQIPYGAEVTGSPLIADLDGGMKDVIFKTENKLYRVNGYRYSDYYAAALFRWFFSFGGGGATASSPAAGDIIPDEYNRLEIVFGTADGKVHCVSEDGAQDLTFPTGGAVESSPAIADIDNDGKTEILIGSSDGNLHCLYYNGAQLVEKTEWPFISAGAINGSPVIGDIRTDIGGLETIISSGGSIVCLDKLGAPAWPSPTPIDSGKSPAIADVDGDGQLDIAVIDNTNNLYCLNGFDGSNLDSWTTMPVQLPGTSAGNPTLGDLDSDGQLEILIPIYNGDGTGSIYCIDAATGITEWERSLLVADMMPKGNIAIADLYGDGKIEAVFEAKGFLYCINGSDGSDFSAPAASNAINPMPWPKYAHDPLNTGCFSSVIASYKLTGTVNDELNAPLSGVTITVKRGASIIATAETDAGGQYEITGLNDGVTYTVIPSSDYNDFYPQETAVFMNGDRVQNFVGIEKGAATLNLTGQICDEIGTFMPYVMIKINGVVVAATDLMGHYSIPGLIAKNTYKVSAEFTGYEFLPREYDVIIAKVRDRDPVQNFGGQRSPVISSYALTGKVSDESGVGMEGAVISMPFFQTGGGYHVIYLTKTDANGDYRIEGFKDGGVYAFDAWPDGEGPTFSQEDIRKFLPTSHAVKMAGDRIQNFIRKTPATASIFHRHFHLWSDEAYHGKAISDRWVEVDGFEMGKTGDCGSSPVYQISGFETNTTYRVKPIDKTEQYYFLPLPGYRDITSSYIFSYVCFLGIPAGSSSLYTLSGRVKDEGGQLLTDIPIKICSSTDIARTDGTGFYSISGLRDSDSAYLVEPPDPLKIINYSMATCGTGARLFYPSAPTIVHMANERGGDRIQNFVRLPMAAKQANGLTQYFMGNISQGATQLPNVKIYINMDINDIETDPDFYITSTGARALNATKGQYFIHGLALDTGYTVRPVLEGYRFEVKASAAGDPYPEPNPGSPFGTFTIHADSGVTLRDFIAIKIWTIMSSAGDGGAISPDGVKIVDDGTSQAYAITPDEGYHVLDVLVDGVSTDAITNYTFTNVKADHTISATFEKSAYTISGTVTRNDVGLKGVDITIDDGLGNTYTGATGDDGTYSIEVPAGTYTITPVLSGYIFYPEYRDVEIINESVADQNFIAEKTKTLMGAVWDEDGNFMPDVEILLDGNVMAITQTLTGEDGTVYDGVYVINGLIAEQEYVVEASYPGYYFIPDPAYVTMPSDEPGFRFPFKIQCFIGYKLPVGNTYALFGTVTYADGSPFGDLNMPITLSNGTAVPVDVITRPDGYYGVSLLSGYSYNVTPVHSVYTFIPDRPLPVSIVSSDEELNFTAYIDPVYLSISVEGTSGETTPEAGITYWYERGTSVPITAAAIGIENKFVDWTYDVSTAAEIAAVNSASTTIAMNADAEITAHFAVKTFTIISTAGPEGTITPPGAITVNYGGSQSYTMAAVTPGYHIADVLVDGASIGAVSGYEFTNVTVDHTIHVTFAIDQITLTISSTTGGYTTPSQGTHTYNYNDLVGLNAEVGMGGSAEGDEYEFVNWTDDGTHAVISTVAAWSITLTESRSITANFFQLIVSGGNPPVLDPLGPFEVAVGGNLIEGKSADGSLTIWYVYPDASVASSLEFTVTATDPDGDPLTFSAANFPAGAAFDPATQVFSWQNITESQVGIYNVTFTVSDGTESDSEQATIYITRGYIGRDHPPILDRPIPARIVNVGEPLVFDITAADPYHPSPGDSFVFTSSYAPLFDLWPKQGTSFPPTIPDGAKLYTPPLNGNEPDPTIPLVRFLWGNDATYNPAGHNPTEAQIGTHVIRIFVRDIRACCDRELVTIIVNGSPTLGVPGQGIAAGNRLTVNLADYVTDANLPDDSLAYSSENLPAGAALDSATGVFTWTPASAGTYDVTFTVTDQGGLQAAETVTITVT